jgi:NAD(P)-dependent dehydrogenase (short-subunit alcohol dehydrogenase family)
MRRASAGAAASRRNPMLMRVIERARSAPAYPELAGKRILLTGVCGQHGVDVARAFAEHRCRLILQFCEDNEQTQAVAEIVAPAALEIEVFGPVGNNANDAVAFGRAAAQAFGGLDAVINFVPLYPRHLDARATVSEIEERVAELLLLPCVLSKIAANRMAMTLTEGVILNVAMLPDCADPMTRMFAVVAKAALSAMTRAQAAEWAAKAIQFNAIAPQTASVPAEPGLSGEPDIAAMALYLASGRGAALCGHVFEARCRAADGLSDGPR